MSQKEQKKKPNNYLLAGLTAVAVILVIFTGYHFTDSHETSWGEYEISVFLDACKEGDPDETEHDLSDNEVNLYCECAIREFIEIFPNGPSMIHPDPDDAIRIRRTCYEEAVGGNI